MSNRRDPEVRASHAAAGYRKQLRAAEARLAAQEDLIAALQRDLVRSRVVVWLDDVEDFWIYIGLENVLVEGRVDPELLEARVHDLLVRKPGLAKIPRVELTSVSDRP